MAAGCYLLRQTFHRRQGGLWAWLLFQAVSSKVSTLGHSGGLLAQHSPTAGKQFNQVQKIIQFDCHYSSTHNAAIFTNFDLIPVLHPSLLPRARLFSTATQPESPLFRSKRRFQAHAFRIVPRNAGCHPSLPPPRALFISRCNIHASPTRVSAIYQSLLAIWTSSDVSPTWVFSTQNVR
ncbi:hypothetical protein CCUS01_14258 [Colletotrichum cuscutae]|uniref:Uncharacterized protein n=1 Tax=Colletotrichum cuscutae TaxID=1209917 RepID=A0AAJ0DL77_9PEZI|nr:hypothetical protein CCUS01_14258 [Colletotrichum cuscutae]